MVTTERTEEAPKLVLAGISDPFSVFVSQNVTQEHIAMRVKGI